MECGGSIDDRRMRAEGTGDHRSGGVDVEPPFDALGQQTGRQEQRRRGDRRRARISESVNCVGDRAPVGSEPRSEHSLDRHLQGGRQFNAASTDGVVRPGVTGTDGVEQNACALLEAGLAEAVAEGRDRERDPITGVWTALNLGCLRRTALIVAGRSTLE